MSAREGDRGRIASLETLATMRAGVFIGPEASIMKTIVEVIERLNAAWPAGEFDQLTDVFDPAVVLVPIEPGDGQRLVGRDAVIQSYREFVEQAGLHQLEFEQPEIDVFGTTAVASCPYRIDYEIGGRRWIGTGRDLLVLHEGGSGWRVVWRSLVAGEEQEVDVGREGGQG